MSESEKRKVEERSKESVGGKEALGIPAMSKGGKAEVDKWGDVIPTRTDSGQTKNGGN